MGSWYTFFFYGHKYVSYEYKMFMKLTIDFQRYNGFISTLISFSVTLKTVLGWIMSGIPQNNKLIFLTLLSD
jgi:hypothetical protein